MHVNADLHIHGRYSISVSKNMTIKVLAREAPRKGVQLVGTGDCLHNGWLRELKAAEEVAEGTYELGKTRFVLTAEVEDNKRVHHLLLFPDIGSASSFRESIKGHSKNIDTDGRPNVRLPGEKIGELACEVGALFGPCHAFTPWTSLYASHDSLGSCYGEYVSSVDFLELGLSADSSYGDRISELHGLTFLTNSDAHSPYPLRLAREFNRFEMKEVTFEELRLAIKRKKGRRPVLNVGLPPAEGKYNESACIKCYTHYTLPEAVAAGWKCTKCGKRVKKGVRDRVEELSDTTEIPEHSPPYLHLIPLAEIISKAVGAGTNTKKVKEEWEALVGAFGDEVSVLVDREPGEVGEVTSPAVAWAVRAFREGLVRIRPGGGGMYGVVEIPDEAEAERARKEAKQVRKERAGPQRTMRDY